MNRQQGFTLIELMIVVAIIGILAAIAIPAYQDYVIRAKVTEAVNVASAAKTSVTEYNLTNNSWPNNNNEAGIGAVSSQYVESITVNGGVITVAVRATVGAAGLQILLSPSSGTNAIDWSCYRGSTSAENSRYLPANCRTTP